MITYKAFEWSNFSSINCLTLKVLMQAWWSVKLSGLHPIVFSCCREKKLSFEKCLEWGGPNEEIDKSVLSYAGESHHASQISWKDKTDVVGVVVVGRGEENSRGQMTLEETLRKETRLDAELIPRLFHFNRLKTDKRSVLWFRQYLCCLIEWCAHLALSIVDGYRGNNDEGDHQADLVVLISIKLGL